LAQIRKIKTEHRNVLSFDAYNIYYSVN